ncbi:MAG: sugar O-acetyltransferase [Bacteroides sp.]|nr:sugar O-acetyltransferase [Bacteroides sp.]
MNTYEKKEMEKMRNGELYCFADPEVDASARHAKKLCARLQTMTVYDEEYREVIEELIPGFPKTATICPPFVCDHGSGIQIGEQVFINHNCVMLDCGYIRIGRHTLIGPNCQFYTPQHPMDYLERRKPQETGLPITIGEDCWLGGSVVVCPGVTIGNRCIIAAGSVVTKDIPDDSLAAGCPAVVKKKLNTE